METIRDSATTVNSQRLEKYTICYFRRQLKEVFRDLPYDGGARLSYDKDFLEKLIFSPIPAEELTNGLINNGICKRIALPGEVLAHIDLSNVSFKGVDLKIPDGEYLDLSRTNAHFLYNGPCVQNCNLSRIGECKVELQPFKLEKIAHCCLAGMDFSKTVIGVETFLSKVVDVDFTDTGLHIILNKGEISCLRNFDPEKLDELRCLIKKGYLSNCYLGYPGRPRRIMSKEEREERKGQSRKLYYEAQGILSGRHLELVKYVKKVKKRQGTKQD